MTSILLSRVLLAEPISDPLDRSTMPMSTVIASEQWLIQATWDGSNIGDVHIFKNENTLPSGVRQEDSEGVPMPYLWTWWTGIPCGKIKQYFLLDRSTVRPDHEKLPFDAQREAKPRSPGEKRPASV
jgi:hypothetical protein